MWKNSVDILHARFQVPQHHPVPLDGTWNRLHWKKASALNTKVQTFWINLFLTYIISCNINDHWSHNIKDLIFIDKNVWILFSSYNESLISSHTKRNILRSKKKNWRRAINFDEEYKNINNVFIPHPSGIYIN